eukprot:760539-Hanusia_phi.AAC.4
MTNFDYTEAEDRFFYILRVSGVKESLSRAGCKQGDTVGGGGRGGEGERGGGGSDGREGERTNLMQRGRWSWQEESSSSGTTAR